MLAYDKNNLSNAIVFGAYYDGNYDLSNCKFFNINKSERDSSIVYFISSDGTSFVYSLNMNTFFLGEEDQKSSKIILNKYKSREIILDEFKVSGLKLKFKKPTIFKITEDRTRKVFTINYPRYNMLIYVEDINEIEKELKEYIFYLWMEYAKSNTKMTNKALSIKNNLLRDIREI